MVLILGAGSHIGKSIAISMAKQNTKLVLIDDRKRRNHLKIDILQIKQEGSKFNFREYFNSLNNQINHFI